MGEAVFRERLAAVMDRLADELAGAASVRRDGSDWTIQPTRPTASPIWVAGDNAWTLSVGFGRGRARIELGYSSKQSPEEELEDLGAICRAVIDGRLVEQRRRSACRWRLTLDDGSVLRGSANWLLPALLWTRIQQERFAPYADPGHADVHS